MPAHNPQSDTTPLPHYVGITGVQDPNQATALMESAKRYQLGASFSHTVMLGCLVSSGILNDSPPTHTSKPCRHVADRAILADILAATREHGGLGMLHFELHKSWPGTKGDARTVIELLTYLARLNLRPPVQLNGVLLPEEVNEIHNATGCALVLQFRPEFTEQREETLLKYIEAVAPAVSMILLDPSAGGGHAIDLTQALHSRDLLESRFPGHFTYGFAGGLGGITSEEVSRTTNVVKEIRSALQNTRFSVDTETRVRESIPGSNTDQLALGRCDAYLLAVVAGLRAS